jgi:hypothetical protein
MGKAPIVLRPMLSSHPDIQEGKVLHPKYPSLAEGEIPDFAKSQGEMQN